MSIARQLFHEFRPLFRMLEEPLAIRSARPFANDPRSLFDDLFFKTAFVSRPAIDVTEEGDRYVVEADLPGVKKENIEVRIGDSGRSVTIEGKVVGRRRLAQEVDNTEVEASDGSPAIAVTKPEDMPGKNQISSERSFVAGSVFSRTVWLPQPVDDANVSAKLDEGAHIDAQQNGGQSQCRCSHPVIMLMKRE